MRGGLLYTDCQDTTPLTNISERRGGGHVPKIKYKPCQLRMDLITEIHYSDQIV